MFLSLLNLVKIDLVRARLRASSASQLIDNKGQWWRSAKFLRILDTEFRSIFPQ